MRSNVSERSSFCAHPRPRRRARWARHRASLYRTIYVLLRATLCGPMCTKGFNTLPSHQSLELNEQKQSGKLKNLDNCTFEISGYRTLSL